MKIKIKHNDPLALVLPELSESFKIKIPFLNQMMEEGLVPNELRSSFINRDYNENFMESFNLMRLRQPHFAKFGFTLLNEHMLNVLAREFKNDKIIDVGAGNGWISHNLQKKGVNIIPVDTHTTDNRYGFEIQHTDIINMKAEDYIIKNSYDTILMSWPDLGSEFAATILDLMPKGKTLIYVGEGEGGCTGNDRFFELLEAKCTLDEAKTERLQKHSQRWAGVHDDWYVYST